MRTIRIGDSADDRRTESARRTDGLAEEVPRCSAVHFHIDEATEQVALVVEVDEGVAAGAARPAAFLLAFD
ncbi:hypothetical protein D3C83_226200 [compost metagenome]